MSESVVSIRKSHRGLATDLQLQLFEQAAAARLIARVLDEASDRGNELKPEEVFEGLIAVANSIARTCSNAAESMSEFRRSGTKAGAR